MYSLTVELSRILCGASAYPRIIDFGKFKEIAEEAWGLGPFPKISAGKKLSLAWSDPALHLPKERQQYPYPSVGHGID